MVILTNRDTASASEILTAALQQNDLGEVVGTRTYGKGTFQEVIDLPDGGALDLTIGEYLTADGSSILGEGVQPDVRVADDPDTERRDEGLDRGLEVLGERAAAGAAVSRLRRGGRAPRPLPGRRAAVRARRAAGRRSAAASGCAAAS